MGESANDFLSTNGMVCSFYGPSAGHHEFHFFELQTTVGARIVSFLDEDIQSLDTLTGFTAKTPPPLLPHPNPSLAQRSRMTPPVPLVDLDIGIDL